MFLNREIPTTKIARMLTGPEVRGCRPILIHFANWKDREEVLAKSRLLRGTNIYVTEDLSRKIREHRNELNKFMREVCVFRVPITFIQPELTYFLDEAFFWYLYVLSMIVDS